LLTVPAIKRLAPGYLFVAYIAIYTAGRLWIEALRIDQAHQIFGVRLNIWVSGLVLVVALIALIRSQQPGLGRETVDSTND
jgi:prolipoprotein diacylglyceryltransferase